jgi:aromatic ring-opening dioxygenase LigB subunit
MSISCAVLMCHAPIVIPQIAGLRERECAGTTRAMRETARALVAHEPQLLVLISPHAPRREQSWGVTSERELRGSFARFGYPELDLDLHGSPLSAAAILDAARGYGLPTHSNPGRPHDHGA